VYTGSGYIFLSTVLVTVYDTGTLAQQTPTVQILLATMDYPALAFRMAAVAIEPAT
jgi:hypothetical protein